MQKMHSSERSLQQSSKALALLTSQENNLLATGGLTALFTWISNQSYPQ